jgi:hypothetical protein
MANLTRSSSEGGGAADSDSDEEFPKRPDFKRVTSSRESVKKVVVTVSRALRAIRPFVRADS